jgi:hypothetical protein
MPKTKVNPSELLAQKGSQKRPKKTSQHSYSLVVTVLTDSEAKKQSKIGPYGVKNPFNIKKSLNESVK